ncbi:MAG: lamin tail domain-containing protein [Polyangiaceae bacterium]|nr:lamin tail domain-containing protein [Polyangiaceae bacterium]
MRSPSVWFGFLSLLALPLFGGCGGRQIDEEAWVGHEVPPPPPPPPTALPIALRINEVVSDNEGVYVDEYGQTDDYIEVYNASDEPIELGDVWFIDASGRFQLPEGLLAPGEVRLLWADAEPEQGANHLPPKIAREGERLRLELADGTIWDSVSVPSLAEHHAYARFPDGVGRFVDCGWASPARANGPGCEPAAPPGLPEVIEFAPFTWPEPWPATPSPVELTELALRPADFVEVRNTTDAAVDLTGLALRIAPSAVGFPWPTSSEGAVIAWPATTLAPGARLVVPISAPDLGTIPDDPRFEGVVTVWDTAADAVVDRVDFDQWPGSAVLARDGSPAAFFRYCAEATPGDPNDRCTEITDREVSDHLRALRTMGDFEALAAARARTGISGVEFIVDMNAGDRTTLLDSADWDLHYLFISEVIDREPHADRCTSEGYRAFHQGWVAFSWEQYYRVEGRRYLLGNLVHHAGPDLHTVEFAVGDEITPELMERAFYAVLQAVPDPTEWAIRPQDLRQVEVAQALEGEVPLVDPNAPYRDVTFQPLTPAVAYGTLRFVPADAITGSSIGPHDILITERVPNDLPFIAGLVTEAIQTPLSHVNILSRARGTPNMYLRDARRDPRIEPLIGDLVRIEVRAADFSLRVASAEEAVAFWEEREGAIAPQYPRLDTSRRGPQPLADHDFGSLPAVGGKAAQLAELLRVPVCARTALPDQPFALPVVHSLEHFTASGAEAQLAELRADPAFVADTAIRDAGLATVRELIRDHPVDPQVLEAVLAEIARTFPDRRLRFRSSSNTEDLASFSGAGLYDSVPWEPLEGRGGVEEALRTVWASLWNTRAYDEREAYRVDQSSVAMAILVHPAYHHEAANGVVVSRDILDPMRGDRYYVNAQIGEALVTNPAPGVLSDQLAISPGNPARQTFRSESSLPGNHPVLSLAELDQLTCSMYFVHQHFRDLLDPEHANGWFAMDVEFKLMGPERTLAFKQARPYSLGVAAPEGWCDL